jgi:hypothetical protein
MESKMDSPSGQPSACILGASLSEFLIIFDPPLPPAVIADRPIVLEDVDIRSVSQRYTQDHDVSFAIDGEIFSYYPSSLLTVLNDIHLEWTLIQKRLSHDLTLSGYTVLEASYEHGRFQFHNPAWPPAPVGNPIDAVYLECKFRASTAAIWNLVCSIEKGDWKSE